MQPLNLPPSTFKFKELNGKRAIFDIIRKKYVILTPEEWVRQNFIHFLIESRQYPKALIKLEFGVKYNELAGRSDITVFDRKGEIFMLVECKAPHIAVSNEVFAQASRYNIRLKAKYMVVTNGLLHFCCCINQAEKKYDFLEDIPSFEFG